MERHPNDMTTDEEIDEAFERAKAFESFPTIVEAEFIAGPKQNYLSLLLSDGLRMLIPKEMLSELKDATVEQATHVVIKLQGLSVWWPQLDDGLYLPDFLEHRWAKSWAASVAA